MTKTTNAGAPAAVVVCDPPWAPRDTNDNGGRGASHKYQVMTTDEIAAMALPDRAEKHVLFLWRLASMQVDALRVLDAWGYTACAEVVWQKLRACQTCAATGRVEAWRFGEGLVLVPGADRICPDCNGLRGTPHLGLGHYTRAAHEVAIIARPKRGSAPERLAKDVPSIFAAPMLLDVDGLLGTSCACGHERDEHEPRGCCWARDENDRPIPCGCVAFRPRKGALAHSAKPDAFFERVEALYPGPRVELFSRRTRPGWSSSHSDQAGSLDEVARVMRDVWPGRVREERLAKARRAAR